jgi:hypothetical protein
MTDKAAIPDAWRPSGKPRGTRAARHDRAIDKLPADPLPNKEIVQGLGECWTSLWHLSPPPQA